MEANTKLAMVDLGDGEFLIHVEGNPCEVALVNRQDVRTDRLSSESAKELAELFVAATDLLEAAMEAEQELREYIADCIEDANEDDFRVVRLLQAAIAKATGKAVSDAR